MPAALFVTGLDFDRFKWRGSHEKGPLATLNSAAILFEDSVPASWEMLCFATAETSEGCVRASSWSSVKAHCQPSGKRVAVLEEAFS
jgi:hypothetical protein